MNKSSIGISELVQQVPFITGFLGELMYFQLKWLAALLHQHLYQHSATVEEVGMLGWAELRSFSRTKCTVISLVCAFCFIYLR